MKRDDVIYTIHCEPEIDPYIGYFAYDTEAENEETEQWIREQLESGNEWAWCSVTVTARFGDETGEDHLSGCSYRSEEDFRGPGGYFEDMKAEALAVLEERIERAGQRAAEYFGKEDGSAELKIKFYPKADRDTLRGILEDIERAEALLSTGFDLEAAAALDTASSDLAAFIVRH